MRRKAAKKTETGTETETETEKGQCAKWKTYASDMRSWWSVYNVSENAYEIGTLRFFFLIMKNKVK